MYTYGRTPCITVSATICLGLCSSKPFKNGERKGLSQLSDAPKCLKERRSYVSPVFQLASKSEWKSVCYGCVAGMGRYSV